MGSQVHKNVKRALTPDQIQLVSFCNQQDGAICTSAYLDLKSDLKVIEQRESSNDEHFNQDF
jgi:hypothetical protein